MPRVSTQTRPQKGKLDVILTALLTRPEASCVVGDNCGCGEPYGGESIESICSFLTHGGAARRLFVARGGLHVLSRLLDRATNDHPKVKDELDENYEDPVFFEDGEGRQEEGTRALGGLVMLQALTNFSDGRQYVLSQAPGLITKVFELAKSDDEVLCSGSLQVLGGWVQMRDELLSSTVSSKDIISLCLDSIDHPSLALRRNAAHLFAVIDIQEDGETRMSQLAASVKMSLASDQSSPHASPYPIMVGFSSSPASTAMGSKRRLVLGFTEIIRALSLSDPPNPLLKPHIIETMTNVFACAWNLPVADVDVSRSYWLHDHQIRESCLDALVDLLRFNSWVLASSDQCFVTLYQLVMALIGKAESVGHMRSALALLGSINIPSTRSTSPPPAPSPSTLAVLLELLVEMFDSAWLSDQKVEGRETTQQARESPDKSTLPPPLSQEVPIFSTFNQISLLSLPPANQSTLVFSSKPPLIRVEEGVGYRIILQVLQAWRQIFSRCNTNPILLERLNQTRWRECVSLASQHSRQQVSSASIDLLASIKDQTIKDHTDNNDLLKAFAAVEEDQGLLDLEPFNTNDELGHVFNEDPSNDPDMVEFLRSFLDASLKVSGGEETVVAEDQAGTVTDDGGMFSLEIRPDDVSRLAMDENEAREIQGAMKLLPNADRKKECIKYDMLFEN